MSQPEQVIAAMSKLGGYATLKQLYKHVDVSKWGTRTPHATIRQIVQMNESFFKIRPGLWALNTHKDKLPAHVYSQNANSQRIQKEHNHSYYQGLLLEIGKLKSFQTYVPRQDKNKVFLGTTLGEVGMLDAVYPFGYEKFVGHVETIDVSWFNDRNMPAYLFEVEHTTSMKNSLIKFNELADFNVQFYIVADESRKREFHERLKLSTFRDLNARVKFYDYEKLSRWHASESERADFALL